MDTLQDRHVVVHATDHEGRDGEQLEVLRFQRRGAISARQRLEGVHPGPLQVRLTASLELAASRLPSAHYWHFHRKRRRAWIVGAAPFESAYRTTAQSAYVVSVQGGAAALISLASAVH